MTHKWSKIKAEAAAKRKSNMDKYEISCPECEMENEAIYDGTSFTCANCGYVEVEDGETTRVVNTTERDAFRKEWERDKEERKFYQEYETPNDRDMLR
jgi:transposase-like protein